jgi:hypothetical protein
MYLDADPNQRPSLILRLVAMDEVSSYGRETDAPPVLSGTR